MKVTLGSELEGYWEIESHSETKCEKGNLRESGSRRSSEKEADESWGLGKQTWG